MSTKVKRYQAGQRLDAPPYIAHGAGYTAIYGVCDPRQQDLIVDRGISGGQEGQGGGEVDIGERRVIIRYKIRY